MTPLPCWRLRKLALLILQIKQWEVYIRVTSGFSALSWQTWQDLLLGSIAELSDSQPFTQTHEQKYNRT